MRVKMLKERRVKVNKLSTQVYPINSTPDVDPDLGAIWIAEGAARDMSESEAPQLSGAEVAVLKVAANQILTETAGLAAAEGAAAAGVAPVALEDGAASADVADEAAAAGVAAVPAAAGTPAQPATEARPAASEGGQRGRRR